MFGPCWPTSNSYIIRDLFLSLFIYAVSLLEQQLLTISSQTYQKLSQKNILACEHAKIYWDLLFVLFRLSIYCKYYFFTKQITLNFLFRMGLHLCPARSSLHCVRLTTIHFNRKAKYLLFQNEDTRNTLNKKLYLAQGYSKSYNLVDLYFCSKSYF